MYVAHSVTCIMVVLERRTRASVFCFRCVLLLVLLIVLSSRVLGYLCVPGVAFLKLPLKELEV